MMDVAGLRDYRPARKHLEVLVFNFLDVVHLETDMIQSHLHAWLAKRRSFFKECEIKKTVSYRDISRVRAGDLFGLKKPIIGLRKFFGIFGNICDIFDDRRHA
jgi:hypothetical protein